MVIYLNELLPTILYILLFILIITMIILVYRLIKTLDKVDRVVEDVDSKSRKLNGVFDIIDNTADGISQVSDLFVNGLTDLITGLFKKNKKKEKKDE